MTGSPRYWNVFRRTPSGRDQKRILNRAVTCPLCGKPLGAGRALYQAWTGFSQSEMIAAHPACADSHMRQLTERLMDSTNWLLRKLTDPPAVLRPSPARVPFPGNCLQNPRHTSDQTLPVPL